MKERSLRKPARSLWLMKGKKASISQDRTKSFYVIPASVRAPTPFQNAFQRVREQLLVELRDELTSHDGPL